jgi:hypothetical protein
MRRRERMFVTIGGAILAKNIGDLTKRSARSGRFG